MDRWVLADTSALVGLFLKGVESLNLWTLAITSEATQAL
jgi:hypothetical protein